MASSKTRTIDEIDDIIEMAQAMEALGMSSKGLKTLDEMKERVKKELHQSAKTPSWTAGQAFRVLSEAKDEDARKKQVLLNLYENAESCLDKMDETTLSLLQQNMGNVGEKMNSHKFQLTHKEYFLLVAGETSSGKSSLVNLILGEELLPYSVLSTTSTICELKYGEERRIVAHFKDKDLPTVTTLLQEHPKTKQNYLEQISPFVHVKSEREKGSVYKKIELFWPHSLLQKGVVIIDSPGIGESDIMDEIVTQYLPQAFAFVYTINSANAGGVQKDRLEKLIEEVKKVSEVSLEQGQQMELPSKCALFVCNKWDQVPEKEVQAVKNHVVTKLKRCWPGLDPESQIIYMSTMKASKGQNIGFITEDFLSLMNGLRAMVLTSIDSRLEMHWKWLYHLLSRIIYQAKAFVMNASRDREVVVEKIGEVRRRLNSIERKQSEVIADLDRYLQDRLDMAKQKLSGFLSSDEVKARFTSWSLDEVPNVERSWEATENQIMKALSSRLREIIEQWEEDNQVFATARDSLVRHFQQRYNIVEGQLRDLQDAVTADNVDVTQIDLSDSSFTLGEKVMIGVTSPIWFPFGLVVLVIGAPIVGIVAIKDKVEDKRKIKQYKEDKCGYLAKKSASYLNAAKGELRIFVKNQLDDAKRCLKQIEARIPEMIKADKMLCDKLIDETRSKEEITALYQPIFNESSRLRGQLALFGIQEVRVDDISSEYLDWKEDMSSRLGTGTFGAVYKGTMKRDGVDRDQPVPVALKVCNFVLQPTNASDIMAEVELLRKLEHPHIVKYYGTSLLQDMNTVRVIFVMEKCKENLKSHIFGHPESIPGISENSAVAREVCRWAKEITTALNYIHKQGVVHRDLKLENILISDDNSVKVTDVGVSKPVIDITGTLAGTPVYIAPEVFHSEMYDCKADIYSLGIMLWEMWYGEQAFAMVPVKTLGAFFAYVDEGQRPEHVKGCKQPPARWKRLMDKCWERNPEERPTAKTCYTELTTLTSELVTPL